MATRAVILMLSIFGLVSGRSFLGTYQDADRAYITSLFGTDHGIINAGLETIRATLLPLFEALPQSEAGQLSPALMRYVVERYFSQRHGWTIKGFDPHATENSEASESQALGIMHRRGYLEAVLRKITSRQGFTLQDMVLLVAALETLIYDENLNSVQKAYHLNNISTFDMLSDRQSVDDLLTSYFMVEHIDGAALNMSLHKGDRADINRWYPHFPETKMFMDDVVGNDCFQQRHLANPFLEQQTCHSLDFAAVSRITRTIDEQFGPFSNHECHDMKLKLAEMDVHGTGRVKLADFYRGLASGGAWQFHESAENLKQLGALDDSSAWLGPQVLISNYIVGKHNCISSSEYYDVCCLNECDGIFQHLEMRIGAPRASAVEITRAIEEGITFSPLLSSSAPTEARNLSATLKTRLLEIASHHKDMIPLHGRLFAQWLHYAFPRECPYPHMPGTVSTAASGDSVTKDEVLQHIKSEAGRRAPSPEAGQSMWNPQEVLLTPSHASQNTGFSSLRQFMLIIMLALFCTMVLKEMGRLRLITKHSKTDVSFASYDI